MAGRPKGCGTSAMDGCSAHECHYPYCKADNYSFMAARASLKKDRADTLAAWKRGAAK